MRPTRDCRADISELFRSKSQGKFLTRLRKSLAMDEKNRGTRTARILGIFVESKHPLRSDGQFLR